MTWKFVGEKKKYTEKNTFIDDFEAVLNVLKNIKAEVCELV